MSKRLTDKVAIVTGGGRGIGRAIVEQYALEGAKVVITDILDAEIEALSAELNARAGAEATVFHHLDVRDAASWQSVVALALSKFGGLDILVNNAGYLAQSDADRSSTSPRSAASSPPISARPITARRVASACSPSMPRSLMAPTTSARTRSARARS